VDVSEEDGSLHAPKVVPHNGFEPGATRATFEGAGFENVVVGEYAPFAVAGRVYGRWVLTADRTR